MTQLLQIHRARTQYVAEMMGDQDVHGRITAALKQSMTGLEGQATFAHVENTFCTRCIRQDSVDVSLFGVGVAIKILLIVVSEWKTEKDGIFTKGHAKKEIIKSSSLMWTDNWLDLVSLGGKMGTRT